jgi:hypothetical protein
MLEAAQTLQTNDSDRNETLCSGSELIKFDATLIYAQHYMRNVHFSDKRLCKFGLPSLTSI